MIDRKHRPNNVMPPIRRLQFEPLESRLPFAVDYPMFGDDLWLTSGYTDPAPSIAVRTEPLFTTAIGLVNTFEVLPPVQPFQTPATIVLDQVIFDQATVAFQNSLFFEDAVVDEGRVFPSLGSTAGIGLDDWGVTPYIDEPSYSIEPLMMSDYLVSPSVATGLTSEATYVIGSPVYASLAEPTLGSEIAFGIALPVSDIDQLAEQLWSLPATSWSDPATPYLVFIEGPTSASQSTSVFPTALDQVTSLGDADPVASSTIPWFSESELADIQWLLVNTALPDSFLTGIVLTGEALMNTTSMITASTNVTLTNAVLSNTVEIVQTPNVSGLFLRLDAAAGTWDEQSTGTWWKPRETDSKSGWQGSSGVEPRNSGELTAQQFNEPYQTLSDLMQRSGIETNFNNQLPLEHQNTKTQRRWRGTAGTDQPDLDFNRTNARLLMQSLPLGMLPIGGEAGLEAYTGGRSYRLAEDFVVQTSLICDDLELPVGVEPALNKPTELTALANLADPSSIHYHWVAIGGSIVVVHASLLTRKAWPTDLSQWVFLNSTKFRKQAL